MRTRTLRTRGGLSSFLFSCVYFLAFSVVRIFGANVTKILGTLGSHVHCERAFRSRLTLRKAGQVELSWETPKQL